MEMVSIFPDEVVSVMYQTMAYCTSEEPNRETVCAVKKRRMEFFQVISFIFDISFQIIVIVSCHSGRKKRGAHALCFKPRRKPGFPRRSRYRLPHCGRPYAETKGCGTDIARSLTSVKTSAYTFPRKNKYTNKTYLQYAFLTNFSDEVKSIYASSLGSVQSLIISICTELLRLFNSSITIRFIAFSLLCWEMLSYRSDDVNIRI